MRRISGSVSLLLMLLTGLLNGCDSVARSGPSTLTQPFPTNTVAPSIGQHEYKTAVQIETADNVTQTVDVYYLLYLPSEYGNDHQQEWPMILYLHGSGEIGRSFTLLRTQLLPKTLDQQTDFPFIVVSPQLPIEWSVNGWSDFIGPVNALLDNIEQRYAIDSRRIYLTGISLGGFATWEFALRYPSRFAAIVPIAGGYLPQSDEIPENICDLKNLPVWVFHGEQDTSVLPFQAKVMVDALNTCGGNVRFTLYPDASHDTTWENAYQDPDLYQWLLEQRLR